MKLSLNRRQVILVTVLVAALLSIALWLGTKTESRGLVLLSAPKILTNGFDGFSILITNTSNRGLAYRVTGNEVRIKGVWTNFWSDNTFENWRLQLETRLANPSTLGSYHSVQAVVEDGRAITVPDQATELRAVVVWQGSSATRWQMLLDEFSTTVLRRPWSSNRNQLFTNYSIALKLNSEPVIRQDVGSTLEVTSPDLGVR